MNTELTEREQKLVDYIQKLLVMISIQATYIQAQRKWWEWLLNNMSNMKSNDLETDLIGYLNSEFGLDYRKMSEEELFENKDKA